MADSLRSAFISNRQPVTPVKKADDLSDLPEVLAEIAGVIGREGALDIAYLKGGHRAHFPAKVGDDHWLVKALGRTDADKLCDHFRVNHTAGVTLQIPLGQTSFYKEAKKQALVMRAEGKSISSTARLLGVTMRSVEKWWAKENPPDGASGGNMRPIFQRNRIEDDREGDAS